MDLILAAIVLALVALLALLAGLRVARRWPPQRVAIVCAIVLAALFLFLFRFHGTLQMARLVPFSSAIVLANWIPVAGAFLAGATFGQNCLPQWRRFFLAGLVLLVSAYSVLCCFQGLLPLRRPADQPMSSSPQSRPSSCGPCCAAILLRCHGIDATEREMLRLCLTSYRGCPALGLYRGLKLKTAGTDWDVQVVSCTVDELLEIPGPLLLRIAIPRAVILDGDNMAKERRTYQHAVLLLGSDHRGHVEIRDPAIPERARHPWRVEDLREQWLGEGLRLVPRGVKPQED